MTTEPRPRLRSCVERWPDAATGAYDPRCCRFPKSCSADVYEDSSTSRNDLEATAVPEPAEPRAATGIPARNAPEVAELWADEMRPLDPGTPFTCPRCHGDRFTVDWAADGLTLECWDCPTYIGVREITADVPRFIRRLRQATAAETVTAIDAAALLGTTVGSAYSSLLVYERRGFVSRAGSARQDDKPGRNPILWQIRPQRQAGDDSGV